MTRLGVASLVAVVGMGLSLTAPARGAAIDFSSGPTTYQPADLSDFAAGGGGQTWTTPAAGTWQDQYDSGANYGSPNPWGANLLTTNGLPGSYFKMSTDLAAVSVTDSTTPWSTGFSLLGDANQSTAASPQYWYGVAIEWDGTTASLDILSKGGWYGISSIASAGPQTIPFFATNTSYNLDVVGDYNASNQLTLTATLTDLTNPANTLQVATAALSNPDTGAYFGYHDDWDARGTGVSGVIQYSNFVLTNTATAVPEPASLSVLALGGMGLLARRRRKV